MAKASEILNNLLDYLERSGSARVPDFDPRSLSNTGGGIIEYLERRERDRPPQERAEEEDVEPDAPGVLAIGGNLVGRKTAKGWLLATSEPPKEPESLPDEREFWGEILTDETGGAYTAKEKARTNATTWADLTPGWTGTCYEANDVAGIAVGTIIKIRVEYDTGGTLRYVFDSGVGTIPPGTVDNQVLVWTAAAGWHAGYVKAI